MKVPRRLKTIVGIPRQAGADDTVDNRWRAWLAFGKWCQRLFGNRAHLPRIAGVLERPVARNRLVEHSAQREKVAASVHVSAIYLLRSHVSDRADECAGPRQRLRRSRLSRAERRGGHLSHRKPDVARPKSRSLAIGGPEPPDRRTRKMLAGVRSR